MVRRKIAYTIRKTHRYLGIFLGIQFLIWTLSGMYFSWTDIDEIHGDQFVKENIPKPGFTGLLAPAELGDLPIKSLALREIDGEPYYWVNDKTLIHARTGKVKNGITENEALNVAAQFMIAGLAVKSVTLITETNAHHEYRGRPLPGWVVNYEHPEAVKAYVSERDGSFQMVRHRDWRWFDFLWMTHTMDYEGRDNINTTALRLFSVLGVITVMSGFTLWLVSSPSICKLLGSDTVASGARTTGREKRSKNN